MRIQQFHDYDLFIIGFAYSTNSSINTGQAPVK